MIYEFKSFMRSIFKQQSGLIYFSSVCVLMLVNFGFFPLSGGEEQYMGLTAQWINPEWITNSFTFTEFPGTRLVFQYITAPFITAFGIQKATFLLRIITLLLASLPLSILIKKIRIPLVGGVLALQLFFSLGQNLFGGEWMVNTYEPKALAYVFALWAVVQFLKNKYLSVAFLLALSTYFHFLIGGWILIVLGILMLVGKKWNSSLKSLGLYSIMMFPFIIYLFNGYFRTALSADAVVDPSWVYCYYRLPHHTGIFTSYEFFVHDSLVGVLLTLIGFVLSIKLLKKAKGIDEKLYSLVIIAFGLNLIFVVAAWVDGILLDQKASFLIKYYPFRTNSIALLLLLLLGTKAVFFWIKDKLTNTKLVTSCLVILVILSALRVNNEYRFSRLEKDIEFEQIVSQIKNTTKKDAVFTAVGIPLYDGRLNRFSRLTERELVATFKFTPAENNKIVEWYKRVAVVAAINKSPSIELNQHRATYGITHLISTRILEEVKGKELIRNNEYIVYELND